LPEPARLHDSDVSACHRERRRYTYFGIIDINLAIRAPIMLYTHKKASYLLHVLALAVFAFSASEATACDSRIGSGAAPKCCAKKRSSSCGCCGPARASNTRSLAPKTPVRADSPSRFSLQEASDCECRPVDPAPANSKPESRPTVERQSRSCHFQTDPDRRPPAVALFACDASIQIPPRLHVYLLTARLLI
jgi:hypothetical protein